MGRGSSISERTALQTRLEELKAKVADQSDAPASPDLMKAVLSVLEMQQQYIASLDPSRLIALWARPKKS